LSEFTYLGAAACTCPDPNAPQAETAFYEAVYLRDNPAGPHEELWYHASGCRSWLRLTRNTRTHEILSVALVRQVSRA
jgi:heterotetrameric sarcosine oxidase delta subunit